MKKNTEKFYFYLRHNKSNQANLDQVFSESRSGTIAHKNQKKITAGSHYFRKEIRKDTRCAWHCLEVFDS